jgi:serine/threonine protein kinase
MAGTAPQIPGCRDLSLIGERVARSLFSATSDRTGRPVTVTVYPPLSEGRTRSGFDGAAATAQLLGLHPSVLTIHDWGVEADGRPWIVTDPQPPDAADTLLKLDGPLTIERALQVGVLLAGAIETAHRAGIVHGDLSPARLVFGAQGEPLLAETGLTAFAALPGLGALNNPVQYHAPPEVLERTEITPATDVYSLATTVYALVAGRAPHEKPAQVTDSNASLLLRVLQMEVPPIDRPGLPLGIEDALRGPLSATPGKRPQQAIELAWLLQDVQRRAGYAVTEPVVLDLDDIEHHSSPRAARRPALGSPAAVTPAAPSTEPLRSLERAPFAPGPTSAPSTSKPWATPERLPRRLAAEALPSEPDLPAATIFPFAEGLDTEPTPGLAPRPIDAWDPPAAARPAADPSPWSPGHEEADEPAEPAEHALWSPTHHETDEPAEPAEHALWSPTHHETDEPAGPAGHALWSGPADGSPAETLWPSTWPAGEPSVDVPTWAEPPTISPSTPAGAASTDGLPPAGPTGPAEPGTGLGPGAAVRSDGDGDGDGDTGSPGPSAPTSPGPWGGMAQGVAAGGHPRPPELDVLPAWYTDPLPNGNGRASSNGGSGGSVPWSQPGGNLPPVGSPTPIDPSPPTGRATPGEHRLPTRRSAPVEPTPPTSRTGPTEPTPPTSRTGSTEPTPPASWPSPTEPPPATRPSVPVEPLPNGGSDGPLPGAGDELRSLFGQVREPAPAPNGSSPPPPWTEPDVDPLGPPQQRPPIDLAKLDEQLGPPPRRAPATARGDEVRRDPIPDQPLARGGAAHDGPARLPRRPVVQSWPAPPTHQNGKVGGTRLPPSTEPRPGRASTPEPTRGVGPENGHRPGRTTTRLPAGDPTSPGPASGGSSPAGPPALPVIVLIVVVALLTLGVAWLVIAGDDAGQPASERPDPPPAGTPTDVEATELPEGVQVTWQGDSDASYVVTVLSATDAPKVLPTTIGTSALVPRVGAGPAAGQCYTVALASEAEPAGDGEPRAACVGGAAVGDMRTG